MPSPLVPSLPFRPPVVETHYQRPLVAFDAPCVCGEVVPWTATAEGSTPHCSCDLPASTTGKTSAPGTSLGDVA